MKGLKLKGLKKLLFPGFCGLCDCPGTGNIDLCDTCTQCLVTNRKACRHCAIPLTSDQSGEGDICGHCLTNPGFIQSTIAPYLYEYPVPYIVSSLKFKGQQHFARIMGQLIVRYIEETPRPVDWPDVLVPVPLHWRRQWQRGFNQSAMIASYCANEVGIAMDNKLVKRIINTRSQVELSRSRRMANMRHAFRVNTSRIKSHVAIVDDVMTTGSTVAELARVLKTAGVNRIDVWVFARAFN